jgi:hypothetical protein
LKLTKDQLTFAAVELAERERHNQAWIDLINTGLKHDHQIYYLAGHSLHEINNPGVHKSLVQGSGKHH